MVLTNAQTLAWRLGRHSLDPVAATTVVDVAQRVLALRGWPSDVTEQAIRARQLLQPDPDALSRTLDAGEVIRSYAFRGGSYVFTPDIGAVLLSARTATQIWQTRRWQKQGEFSINDWETLRDVVCAALSAGPLTRDEIGAHLAQIPHLRHLAAGAAGAGADSLYKPLHWWGDICFGPTRDGQATFRLLRGDPHWPGLPDVDEAGRRAIILYLGAYGPATIENLVYWLAEGLGTPRRRILGWLADLGDEVTAMTVDNLPAFALTADLDEMSDAEPSDAVRLLPAFDPWILGPGTADARLLVPQRRALISHGANFVICGGVVSGTWRLRGKDVMVSWFTEVASAPMTALRDEVGRLSEIRKDELTLAIAFA
ncbi:MAG: DNA glycosylase AlkZ-like family protein [Nakamurella sp.]